MARDTEKLLRAAIHEEARIKFLSAQIRRYAQNAASPRAKLLAQQVFRIPELLELILAHVDDTRSLLSAYSVCRQFFNVIQGSLKLQRSLGFQPDTQSELRTPFTGMRPWNIWGGTMYLLPDNSGSMSWQINHAPTITFDIIEPLRVGSRSRSMLFCQPPLQRFSRVFSRCCAHRIEGDKTVSAKPGSSGITVGDVNDTVKELIAEHRRCPFAHTSWLDDEGSVKVHITLTAIASGEWGQLPGVQEKVLAAQQKRAAHQKKQTELRSYTAAKYSGKVGGGHQPALPHRYSYMLTIDPSPSGKPTDTNTGGVPRSAGLKGNFIVTTSQQRNIELVDDHGSRFERLIMDPAVRTLLVRGVNDAKVYPQSTDNLMGDWSLWKQFCGVLVL